MGNTVSNYHVDIINSLPTVSGMNAKKNFYDFYKTLKKVNFETELIEEFKYFNINRWDIILKSGKIIKLPTERFESSIEKFISIYDKDNFNNFKIFDFRVNGQLILEQELMNQDCLIAEIADDKIRYIIYKFDEKFESEILSKKIFKNEGIK